MLKQGTRKEREGRETIIVHRAHSLLTGIMREVSLDWSTPTLYMALLSLTSDIAVRRANGSYAFESLRATLGKLQRTVASDEGIISQVDRSSAES